MTMLDRMRRHKGWLKWSLAIVCVSFVLLYIPSFLDTPTQGATTPDSVVANVEGQKITVAEFRRVYEQQMRSYRQAYGANLDERMLKQLGIDQRIVQQMIEQEIALVEARRLGIRASDAEVRERIASLPAFQENGQFIGNERYQQILRMQTPPIQPGEFEQQMRQDIIVEKLQAALTGWMTVNDTEVDAEFQKRNEKVKLAVVAFPADKFREGLTATDAEVASWFDGHKDAYRVPEKRKIRFIPIDMQAMRDRVTVTGQEISRYYNENIDQFSTPEQVRASHILLKTEGKDDAAVKKQAEDLLQRIKAGADFAQLAKQFSEDEGSAEKGGDLDYFGKGQMVPEFDQVAFSLQPGQVSDLVKTQYGYHIIKVTDKKAAVTRSLDEVRQQIEDQLKFQKAQEQAQKLADTVAGELKKPEDFDAVAKQNGLQASESGFFQSDEPIAGLGLAPAVTQQAFAMKQGEVSEPLRTSQGFAFITVIGRQDGYIPKLDEVKAKVRDDVLKNKSVDAARAKAAELAPKLKSGDFDKAAKAAGLQVTTTDLIARGAQIGSLGTSAAIDDAAFALSQGGVSDPIVTDTGAAIVKVVEKKDVTPDEVKAGREALRTEMLNERRNRFYAAYMTKARQKMDIKINRDTLSQVIA